MSNLLLILSKAEQKTKEGYYFHFKGFYQGAKIKKLLVLNQNNLYSIIVKQEYLIWGNKVELTDGVLKVKIIKFKKIY